MAASKSPSATRTKGVGNPSPAPVGSECGVVSDGKGGSVRLTCTNNDCCSQYGWCGSSADYCSAATCQVGECMIQVIRCWFFVNHAIESVQIVMKYSG